MLTGLNGIAKMGSNHLCLRGRTLVKSLPRHYFLYFLIGLPWLHCWFHHLLLILIQIQKNQVVSRYVFLQLPEATGHVRTIIPQHGSSADGRLFIGTSKGYVLDGSLQDKFKYLLQVCCINKGLFNLDKNM